MDAPKRRVVDYRLIRVLNHAIAVRVLEVALKTADQRPSAIEIWKTLAKGDLADLELRQVAYHLARLRDAELLPRPLGNH